MGLVGQRSGRSPAPARDASGSFFLTWRRRGDLGRGLSLARSTAPSRAAGTAPVLPLADEDGGWVGRAVAERLADEPSIRVRPVATAAAARRGLQRRAPPRALVVPGGTSDRGRRGSRRRARPPDGNPVKTVDVGLVAGASRRSCATGSRRPRGERAQHELDAARAQAADARARLAARPMTSTARLDDLGARPRGDAGPHRAEGRGGARAAHGARGAGRPRRARGLVARWYRCAPSSPSWPPSGRPSPSGSRPRASGPGASPTASRPPPDLPSVAARARGAGRAADPDAVAGAPHGLRRAARQRSRPSRRPAPPPPALDLPPLPRAARRPPARPARARGRPASPAPRAGLNSFDQNVPGFRA